jgi:hypothetical protein
MAEQPVKINLFSPYSISKRNEKTGLLKKPWYVSPSCSYISASSVDVKELKEKITEFICGLESVRLTYTKNYENWAIDFGTKPILETIDRHDRKLHKIVNAKQLVASRAAIKALEKFPYLSDDYDYCTDFQLRWCNMSVRLYYDETNDEIIVEYNRFSGCSHSFYHIKQKIDETLGDLIIKKK